jgi:hypothetical protein
MSGHDHEDEKDDGISDLVWLAVPAIVIVAGAVLFFLIRSRRRRTAMEIAPNSVQHVLEAQDAHSRWRLQGSGPSRFWPGHATNSRSNSNEPAEEPPAYTPGTASSPVRMDLKPPIMATESPGPDQIGQSDHSAVPPIRLPEPAITRESAVLNTTSPSQSHDRPFSGPPPYIEPSISELEGEPVSPPPLPPRRRPTIV